MSEWLAMGGYGVYVWSSYGLTLLLLLLLGWQARRGWRRALSDARRVVAGENA